MTAAGARPRVLYITGMTRCGSTMLGNVLNEVPGIRHVGELHFLWRNGLLGLGTNSSCGCGAELRDCPVWSTVLAAGAVPSSAGESRAIVTAQDAVLDPRDTAARLAESTGRAEAPAEVATAIGGMAAIYHELAGATSLIVDGSKEPAEAAALAGRADLDVRVLHMVRDPRATVWSYRRSKAYIDKMSPGRAVSVWRQVNSASAQLEAALGDRYLRVRHEDFGADPRGTVADVLAFAGHPGPNPVAEDGTVEMTGNHTVTGNPDRLERGRVPVRADERWRTELGLGTRALVDLLAAPLLLRYGYHEEPAEPVMAGGA